MNARPPHPCDNLPVGTWVSWCHHDEPLELLTEPGRNRVDYIYSDKPEHERAVRLAAFRPVKDQEWAATTYAEYAKVRDAAVAKYDTTRDAAWAEYVTTRGAALQPILDRLEQECPDVPFDRKTGSLRFPEPEDQS